MYLYFLKSLTQILRVYFTWPKLQLWSVKQGLQLWYCKGLGGFLHLTYRDIKYHRLCRSPDAQSGNKSAMSWPVYIKSCNIQNTRQVVPCWSLEVFLYCVTHCILCAFLQCGVLGCWTHLWCRWRARVRSGPGSSAGWNQVCRHAQRASGQCPILLRHSELLS